MSGTGWFVASAIAGCVVGDAFPVGFRRGGRGLVPLVSGLVIALPYAGLLCGIIAIPVALLTRMRGGVFDASVTVAVPLGLWLGTHDWRSLGAGRGDGRRHGHPFPVAAAVPGTDRTDGPSRCDHRRPAVTSHGEPRMIALASLSGTVQHWVETGGIVAIFLL